MIRGTTPLHTFTLPSDVRNYDDFIITYRQDNKTIIEKNPDEVFIDGKQIKVRLSMEETLMFESGKKAFVKIRVSRGGIISASATFSFPVTETLNERPLTPGPLPDYATPDDILEGKVAYVGGIKMVGEIAVMGEVEEEISNKDEVITLPKGYYTQATVQISDEEKSKIIPENIMKGVTILGVEGNATGVDVSELVYIDEDGHFYILVDEEDEDMTIINAILDETAGTVTFDQADIESILQDADKVRIKAQSGLDPDYYCYFYPTLSMLSGKEFFAMLYPGTYATFDITEESTETIPYEIHTTGGNIARYEEISEEELVNAIENYYTNMVGADNVNNVIDLLSEGYWIDAAYVSAWQSVLNPVIVVNNHTTIGPVTLINAEANGDILDLEMVVCGCHIAFSISVEIDAETGDSKVVCGEVIIVDYTYNTVVVQE